MKKKAFSLFELILVIILIGIVYSLVLGKITSRKNIHINNIKDLKATLLHRGLKKLIVYDKCTKTIPNTINPNIFKNIEVYNLINNNIEKIEFNPIKIKDNIYDVCLKFEIFNNRSSSSFIIKKDKNYYVFHPYFRQTKVFDNIEDATDDLTNKKEKEIYINENI